MLPLASFNVMLYVFSEFPRLTVSATLSPGRLLPTMNDNDEKDVIGFPSTAVMMSPSSIPESIADPLATNSVTITPLSVLMFFLNCLLYCFTASSFDKSKPLIPKYPRCTIPYDLISSTTFFTKFAGTANP